MNKPQLKDGEWIEISKYRRPRLHHFLRYKWVVNYMYNANFRKDESASFTYLGARYAAYRTFKRRSVQLSEMYDGTKLYRRIES